MSPTTDYSVTPVAFIDAARLVVAYDTHGSHDLAQIEDTLNAHPSGSLVQVLVQQLTTAIRSPKFSVTEWAAHEIERANGAMLMDAEIDAVEQNAEMTALGIPAEYHDRLRAWSRGAPIEQARTT